MDKKRRNRGRHHARRRRGKSTNQFDILPDELVVAVIVAVADPASLARLALTSRRFAGLVPDSGAWERLYASRYGPPLHLQFRSFGKNWHWLYRAMSCSTKSKGSSLEVGIASGSEPGWVYCGDLRRGVAHGYGFASRMSIHGAGCLCRSAPRADNLSAGGEHYEGHWKEGKQHGFGVHTTTDGSVYAGQWRDGKYCGKGTFVDSCGSRYEGDWKRGQRHGSGVWTHPNGDVHTGQWIRDRCSGIGELVFADGTRTKGRWDDDHLHGRAITISANGDRYDREYVHGTVKGMSVDVHADGSSYVGEVIDDEAHGRGMHVWADGSRYAGDWQRGRRDGTGAMTYADGSCWYGAWKDDQKVDGSAIAHARADAVDGGQDAAGACECMACSDP